MQNDLLKAHGLQPSDSMPSMSLFYYYSAYVKDRNEEEARKKQLGSKYRRL